MGKFDKEFKISLFRLEQGRNVKIETLENSEKKIRDFQNKKVIKYNKKQLDNKNIYIGELNNYEYSE